MHERLQDSQQQQEIMTGSDVRVVRKPLPGGTAIAFMSPAIVIQHVICIGFSNICHVRLYIRQGVDPPVNTLPVGQPERFFTIAHGIPCRLRWQCECGNRYAQLGSFQLNGRC